MQSYPLESNPTPGCKRKGEVKAGPKDDCEEILECPAPLTRSCQPSRRGEMPQESCILHSCRPRLGPCGSARECLCAKPNRTHRLRAGRTLGCTDPAVAGIGMLQR